jgi:hypothetical protein
MKLPNDLQELVNISLEAVYKHPRHELTRANRENLFRLFRTSYVKAGKWLAILTSRKVEHIFAEKWEEIIDKESHFRHQLELHDLDRRTTIRFITKGHLSQLEQLYYYLQQQSEQDIAKRMGDIAEDVVRGFLDQEYASYNANTFYFDILSYAVLKEPKDAYYAFWTAYQTLLASYKDEPFVYETIYIPVDNPSLRVIGHPKNFENAKYNKTTELSDDLLVEEGFAADFAIYAAFAYAYNSDLKRCDPDKLRIFWEWWLNEAIPQAWEKTNVLDESE